MNDRSPDRGCPRDAAISAMKVARGRMCVVDAARRERDARRRRRAARTTAEALMAIAEHEIAVARLDDALDAWDAAELQLLKAQVG